MSTEEERNYQAELDKLDQQHAEIRRHSTTVLNRIHIPQQTSTPNKWNSAIKTTVKATATVTLTATLSASFVFNAEIKAALTGEKEVAAEQCTIKQAYKTGLNATKAPTLPFKKNAAPLTEVTLEAESEAPKKTAEKTTSKKHQEQPHQPNEQARPQQKDTVITQVKQSQPLHLGDQPSPKPLGTCAL